MYYDLERIHEGIMNCPELLEGDDKSVEIAEKEFEENYR